VQVNHSAIGFDIPEIHYIRIVMKKRLIVVCGQQRSGTTALDRAFAKTGLVTDFSEVFHTKPAEKEKESNYFYFIENIENNSVENNSELFKTTGMQRALARNYLRYLENLSAADYYLIDVKYNSWHYFNSSQHNSLFMEMLQEMKVPIINIVRLNLFQQYFSLIYAVASGKWHYREGAAAAEISNKLVINPIECEDSMRRSKQTIALFRGLLEGYGKSIELVYEDMFDGCNISSKYLHKINQIIGLDIQSLTAPFQKTPVNISENIANKKELLQHFAGTEYESMVSDALDK
jgi:LPS sulfotransferase NodH